MKKITKKILVYFLLLSLLPISLFISAGRVLGATTPSLGLAATFGILAGTYTNTVVGTTITGDLGYTTGPAVAPTVSGTTHIADGTYNTAGTDQGSALANLNSQACTHTFPAGAVDLATDTSHGTLGVYAPGVYCTTAASAASIGAGGITLSGSGTYIFRITGALTTDANSVVTLDNGASSCDVFWTPAGATTLGANSTFIGTDIDAAGITIGSTVTWSGRALAFGGTISTSTDTITTTCSIAPTPTPTPTPTATPTPTPTPTPTSTTTTSTTTSSSTTSSSSTSTGDSVSAPSTPCPTIIPTAITPNIIEIRRTSPNSIFLSWGPSSGVSTFNLRYGPSNGNWLYNTDVTGFSTTIGSLPSNTSLWVQVAVRNECQIGEYGGVGSVGGAAMTAQTNSPGFPNAGLAPESNNSTRNLLVGFLLGFSALLVSIQKK